MHVLPQLRKLERKYADVLTVVGIHSAKFNAEKSSDNVREAVRRYEIGHPVVNDADFAIWQSYAARAWPTLMFIDPSGKVIGRHEGEFDVNALDGILAGMIEEQESYGFLVRGDFELSSETSEESILSYPGKITADPDSEILVISDSNHHRVLITDLDGKIEKTLGNGGSPLVSGNNLGAFGRRGFDEPLFDNPQGLVIDGDKLFVADAGAHTIVEVDLANESARTVAGIGEKSLYRHEGGDALKVPLNSPYDLSFNGETLYIAMAGFHQLWAMEIASGQILPFAGTGAENIVDDVREQALLAQPYGIEVSNNAVFFIDSETSALRVSAIASEGRVVTLIGTGLFDFGDYDGVGKEAKLQHPQGLAVNNDAIYIADSYNNKIKSVAIGSLKVRTVTGSGEVGKGDGASDAAQFSEPAGLAVMGDVIYVADTNNHLIRVIDIESGDVSTLDIRLIY